VSPQQRGQCPDRPWSLATAKQSDRFVQLRQVTKLRICGSSLHFPQILVNLFLIKQPGNFAWFIQRDLHFESLQKPALGYSRSKFITGSVGVNVGQETQQSQISNSAETRWKQWGNKHVNVWTKTSLYTFIFLPSAKFLVSLRPGSSFFC
jgi:hypothetical protein